MRFGDLPESLVKGAGPALVRPARGGDHFEGGELTRRGMRGRPSRPRADWV